MSVQTSRTAAGDIANPDSPEPEGKKRRSIIDGARRVFLDKGFDGASMDEVARAAGVSKATIYVYFAGKEDLFQALVDIDREKSAEQLFQHEAGHSDDCDPAIWLHRIGVSFMTRMVQPDHIRLIRMVIAAAEKFPAVGEAFLNGGPRSGIRRLGDLLVQQAGLGRLRIDDGEAAAAQFLGLCQSNIVQNLLFGGPPQLTQERVDASVASAVRVFLAAYGTKPDPGAATPAGSSRR